MLLQGYFDAKQTLRLKYFWNVKSNNPSINGIPDDLKIDSLSEEENKLKICRYNTEKTECTNLAKFHVHNIIENKS